MDRNDASREFRAMLRDLPALLESCAADRGSGQAGTALALAAQVGAEFDRALAVAPAAPPVRRRARDLDREIKKAFYALTMGRMLTACGLGHFYEATKNETYFTYLSWADRSLMSASALGDSRQRLLAFLGLRDGPDTVAPELDGLLQRLNTFVLQSQLARAAAVFDVAQRFLPECPFVSHYRIQSHTYTDARKALHWWSERASRAVTPESRGRGIHEIARALELIGDPRAALPYFERAGRLLPASFLVPFNGLTNALLCCQEGAVSLHLNRFLRHAPHIPEPSEFALTIRSRPDTWEQIARSNGAALSKVMQRLPLGIASVVEEVIA